MYRPVEAAVREERRRIIASIATVALVLAIAGFIIGLVALCRPATTTSSSTPIPALSFKGELVDFVSVYTGCIDVTPRFTANVSAYMTNDGKSVTIFVEADTTPFAMTLPGGCSPPIVVGASIPVLGALITLPVASCTGTVGFAASVPTVFMACVQTGNALSLVPLGNSSLVWTAGITYAAPATWTLPYLIN
jgi:hypothetical protein